MHPIFSTDKFYIVHKNICVNQEESDIAVSSQYTTESLREIKFLKSLTFISHPQIPSGLPLLCYGRNTTARAGDARVSTGCTTAHFSSVPEAVLCSDPRRIHAKSVSDRSRSILEVFHFLGLFFLMMTFQTNAHGTTPFFHELQALSASIVQCLCLLAESLTNNVSAHVCHLKSIIIQTQLIFPPQTFLMSNLWQCPLQPCLFVCVQAHLYSICVRVIDRWWRISWSRLGYVSGILHRNDIPPLVCFPPVSYSSVQSRSARLLLCRLQLFPLPFLSN